MCCTRRGPVPYQRNRQVRVPSFARARIPFAQAGNFKLIEGSSLGRRYYGRACAELGRFTVRCCGPGSRSSVSESVLNQVSFNFKLNSGPKPASRPGSRTSNRLSASNLQVDRLGFAPAAKRTSRCAVSEAWGELGRLDDAACLRVMAAPSAACNVRVACDNDLLRDSELRALPPAGKAEDQTVAAAAAKRA